MADSRPAPGPLTRTSTSFTPNLEAFSAHASAARWAAYGVLLRLPLNPAVPAEAVHKVSPAVSVIVTIVLLNVDWMCATPRLTLRRCLRFLLFAMFQVVRWLGCRVVQLCWVSSTLQPNHPATSPLAEVLHALLPGDRLARALAGPGVRLAALAADREVPAVPGPAVAANVFQPLDVRSLGSAQGPFDQVFPVEDGRDPGDLVVGQFLGPPLRVDAGLVTQPQGKSRPDPSQVAKANVGRLVRRQVNALDTGHGSMLLDQP